MKKWLKRVWCFISGGHKFSIIVLHRGTKIDNEYIKMCTKCDHVHIEKKEPSETVLSQYGSKQSMRFHDYVDESMCIINPPQYKMKHPSNSLDNEKRLKM